jgi:UDP-N-acetylglucosamine acyltransferase
MISPQAIVAPGAEIASDAQIGPFSVIGGDVVVGARSVVAAHVVITGHTSIGEDNRIFQFSSIGEAPQDKKYHDEPTRLVIGDRNVIREYCTISRGTANDSGVTRVGSDNLFMAYTHVAHDCIIGNHVILGNSVGLAGHVIVEDWADISPFSGVHQFCRIGRHSFIGPYSVIKQDVMPYSLTSTHSDVLVFGANSIGMGRRGFAKTNIEALQTAFRLLTRAGLNTSQAVERIKEEIEPCAEVDDLLAFIAASQRGVIKG